jgi:hypothetical protein
MLHLQEHIVYEDSREKVSEWILWCLISSTAGADDSDSGSQVGTWIIITRSSSTIPANDGSILEDKCNGRISVSVILILEYPALRQHFNEAYEERRRGSRTID